MPYYIPSPINSPDDQRYGSKAANALFGAADTNLYMTEKQRIADEIQKQNANLSRAFDQYMMKQRTPDAVYQPLAPPQTSSQQLQNLSQQPQLGGNVITGVNNNMTPQNPPPLNPPAGTPPPNTSNNLLTFYNAGNTVNPEMSDVWSKRAGSEMDLSKQLSDVWLRNQGINNENSALMSRLANNAGAEQDWFNQQKEWAGNQFGAKELAERVQKTPDQINYYRKLGDAQAQHYRDMAGVDEYNNLKSEFGDVFGLLNNGEATIVQDKNGRPVMQYAGTNGDIRDKITKLNQIASSNMWRVYGQKQTDTPNSYGMGRTENYRSKVNPAVEFAHRTSNADISVKDETLTATGKSLNGTNINVNSYSIKNDTKNTARAHFAQNVTRHDIGLNGSVINNKSMATILGTSIEEINKLGNPEIEFTSNDNGGIEVKFKGEKRILRVITPSEFSTINKNYAYNMYGINRNVTIGDRDLDIGNLRVLEAFNHMGEDYMHVPDKNDPNKTKLDLSRVMLFPNYFGNKTGSGQQRTTKD